VAEGEGAVGRTTIVEKAGYGRWAEAWEGHQERPDRLLGPVPHPHHDAEYQYYLGRRRVCTRSFLSITQALL
jgi:hypothetical protein